MASETTTSDKADGQPSKRAQQRARNQEIRNEAVRRLHRVRELNERVNLLGLNAVLLDLSIDISSGYPGSMAIARAIVGDDVDSRYTEAVEVLRELAAGADDHRCWWIPDEVEPRIRAVLAEFAKET